ncbi:MAG: hypothetical protein H8M99_12785 [Gloeobacteraceae cyanobacterium ES-bin-144]|nr:hypothetical protein [Verrucomicrobiales bacterium]
MLKTQSASKQKTHLHERGFALIVTLSLMILLTIIAVGLLTLSSISLRTASKDNDLATARANARMALMLALGELQKSAGPDQRVTARADVLDTDPANQSKNPRLTGVWRSTEIQAGTLPTDADYQKSARDAKFLGWLTSSIDNKARQIDFAKDTVLTTTGSPAPAVTLWDKGSLGPAMMPADMVLASKIPTSPSRGAVAWAIMDEGVKVRINTPYVDGAVTKGAQTAQLGSGERPNVSSIKGLDKLDRKFFEKSAKEFATIEKGITWLNLGLATEQLAPGTQTFLKSLTHDVTSSSVGLFTDTAMGGLKEDFNLLTNAATLPANYAGKSVYQSRLATTGVSDPRWESLQQFARIYTDSTRLDTLNGVPFLKAQGPAGWVAASGSDPTTGKAGTIQRTPPAGVVLMPTVAKVQVVFSLLTRDIYKYPKVSDTTPKIPGTKAEELAAQLHGPWANNFAGSSYDYLLHLLYTPVVTLHNPYNVALEFTELKVIFGNVPFALQVIRNGIPQTTAPAPLDTMYHQAAESGTLAKRFGMTLMTNGGTPALPSKGSKTFRLLPGEVMMFSPFIDPNRTWQQEYGGARVFSDWDNNASRVFNIDGIPGWRGDGIGFDLDWFCPVYKEPNSLLQLRVSSNEVENGVSMNRNGCIGARASDEFSVIFAPLNVPGLSSNKFTVELFAKPPGAPPTDPPVSSGMIEMDYEKATGLQDSLLGPNGTITYPKTGTVNAMEMHSHALTPINSIVTAKPFAVFSAQAKATLGGLNADGEDGKLATKPWCFAHASSGAFSGKVVSEHSANLAHEVALQRLDNGTINLLQYDYNTGRGNSITGQTGNTGRKFGVLYDIPLAPLQTLASLNGANPGGSSGYLPRFAQPIGNSWAHPLLDSAKIITSGGSYPYLDHSFLLNLALYDHFYFSGIADQTGFGSASVTAANLVDDFIAGKPLVDPRIALNAPDGKARTQLATDAKAADAYARIASWQVMNGAFNINSTSVAAWKAMLGSIHDSQTVFNKIDKTAKSSSFANLTATDTSKNQARISRFRLPASESAKNGGDPNESYWLGAREYSDADLQLLAEKIVEQVRQRGPFLSMADFVNRRLGTGQPAQRGALQQAIDNTNLNQNLAGAANAGWEIPPASVSTYKYQNAEAGTGSSFQGAPGYLSQADLLNVLGNAATPRSDTFTIRGYGEARDAANKATATATCEAVIQRVPEYIDPADKAEIATTALTRTANKNFGRRFIIVSFRWLAANEI